MKERAEEMEGPSAGKRRRLLQAAAVSSVNGSAAFASSASPQHLQRKLASTAAKINRNEEVVHVDEVSASEEMARLAAGEDGSVVGDGGLRPHHTPHEMARSTKR